MWRRNTLAAGLTAVAMTIGASSLSAAAAAPFGTLARPGIAAPSAPILNPIPHVAAPLPAPVLRAPIPAIPAPSVQAGPYALYPMGCTPMRSAAGQCVPGRL